MTDLSVLPEVGFGLGIILLAWRYGFEPLRRDEFRSEIRHIRDDLFDFMWRHQLSYEDPAYQYARQCLNGMIYIGGALNPVSIIVAGYLMLRRRRLGEVIASPRSENAMLQAEINRTMTKAAKALLTFLFLQGAFGMIVRACAYCLRALHAFQRIERVAAVGADYHFSMARLQAQERAKCAVGMR